MGLRLCAPNAGPVGSVVTDAAFTDALSRLKQLIDVRHTADLGTLRAAHFQRFAIASNDPNPRYTDEETARDQGFEGLAAPPMFLTAVLGWSAGPRTSDLRADGADGSRIENGFTLPSLRLMGAGQDIELVREVEDGMQVHTTTWIDSVELKQGRSGPLILIVLQSTYEAGDELLTRCRETLIAR
jgi:acyl dehydratase